MTGTIKIEGKNLVFEIHGIDIILAIRKSVTIPLDHISSVSTNVVVSWEPFQQLKIAGASLPGVVKDGMFLSKDGLLFFEMHNPEKCITVSLNNEKYKKIIFEVQDKESTAKIIRDAISSNHME
ncbi:hypothetical protein [Candidatus Nitrosotalea okcheonensis]|uniref:Uncharacterized protein n=1 Tax=Candidatus Nitrosotalea okcheonensis TaxID=1903276 RepID=A0A2H1FFZ7_9ARCH|nr:hypothetical protein [Candidatus Nitrosotalea okcheonensis]SMH71677.1 protein of unknown function [Candidatus Nitrosotalea okcheonensis]